jgi:hypothetical protein
LPGVRCPACRVKNASSSGKIKKLRILKTQTDANLPNLIYNTITRQLQEKTLRQNRAESTAENGQTAEEKAEIENLSVLCGPGGKIRSNYDKYLWQQVLTSMMPLLSGTLGNQEFRNRLAQSPPERKFAFLWKILLDTVDACLYTG